MNTIPGTQLLWLTLGITFIETIFFFIQIYDLFRYPERRWQWLDIFLLMLLITFNLVTGLLPDAHFGMDLKVQYMFAYGISYLTGAYFPFYYCRMYRLKKLRWWATWGAVLFELTPFVICDVLLYAWNGNLIIDREWGVVIPAIYGLVMLLLMLRESTLKYKSGGDKTQYYCELLVWGGIVPWEIMVVFAFHEDIQWLRILLGNMGWIAIIIAKIVKDVMKTRRDQAKLRRLDFEDIVPQILEANSALAGMSARETEIILLLRERMPNSRIAEKLFVSENTVKTHVQNILKKASVSSRSDLIWKLGHPYFKPDKP